MRRLPGSAAAGSAVLAVGLTGGIGSGKSSVGDLLVQRGAVLIDADRIAREVVVPGGPAYQPLVDRFGPGILAADGTIDRAALAALAFADPESLAALNAITHPAISAVMAERRAAEEGGERVVVLDIPLLKAEHRDLLSLDVVVVVDCPVGIAVERLVGQRGFSVPDAEARIAAQVGRDERRRGADFVIDNSGDRAHLVTEVDRVWAVPRGPGPPGALTSGRPGEWARRRAGRRWHTPPVRSDGAPFRGGDPAAPRGRPTAGDPVPERGGRSAVTATRPCWASPAAGRRRPSPGPSSRPSAPP